MARTLIKTIPKNKIQTKILAANVTTNTTVTGLGFSNLVVGKWYEVTGVLSLSISGDTSSSITFASGATIHQASFGSSTAIDTSLALSFKFQAAATTLTAMTNGFAAGTVLQGNNSRLSSYIQLEEVNELEQTSDFS